MSIARRAGALVNASISELQTVRWSARAVAERNFEPQSLARLREIQKLLATVPSTMQGPQMRWLILVMVQNNPECQADLHGMVKAVPSSLADFSVYHYDSKSMDDASFRAFANQEWYRNRVVHRAFVTGSGCTVEAMKECIHWMLKGGGVGRYTHLWKIDSDLAFGLFQYQTFAALVAHRAPFLSQPAIVPWMRGKRATDRASLRAQLAPSPTLQVLGRERLMLKVLPPKDDVEIMCPLIDARILPAVAAAIEPMDTRNDVVAGEAINTIAQAYALAANGPADMRSSARPRRPGGLVFDYVPLIHRDSRLLGWGSRTRASKNETKCPRQRLDGRFGRGDHPHHGKWRHLLETATGNGADFYTWHLSGS